MLGKIHQVRYRNLAQPWTRNQISHHKADTDQAPLSLPPVNQVSVMGMFFDWACVEWCPYQSVA